MANERDLVVETQVEGPTALSLCIVSAIRFYREGLAQLFLSGDVFTVISAAPNRLALEHALTKRPDVVLIDISSREGLDAMHALADRTDGLNIVAAAVSERDTDVHECVQAGVAGYVTRDASAEELIGIVMSVSRGEWRCSPPLSSILRRQLATRAATHIRQASHADTRLTSREAEIVRLIGQDLTNKEIARRLTIEVSTVKSHVHNILEKLRVERRADAATRISDSPRYRSEHSGSLV